MPKPRYKTTNWKQYNKALINRGSLTFWVDEEEIAEWKQSKQGKRGRPRRFNDLAITTALMVKRVFSMPLIALQGFLDSVFKLANFPLVCPHYTCICCRAKEVEVSFKTKTRGAIQHLAIDATGLKVYAEVFPNLLKQTRRKIIEISGDGYHERSLSETAMYRVKQLLGGKLGLRNYNAQVGETYAMIKTLNKLTGLGMPETHYIV